jgi:hypothetical protein
MQDLWNSWATEVGACEPECQAKPGARAAGPVTGHR